MLRATINWSVVTIDILLAMPSWQSMCHMYLAFVETINNANIDKQLHTRYFKIIVSFICSTRTNLNVMAFFCIVCLLY